MQKADPHAVNVSIGKAANALDGALAHLDFWMTVGMAKKGRKGGGETGFIRAGIQQHIYEKRPSGQKTLHASDDDWLSAKAGVAVGHVLLL